MIQVSSVSLPDVSSVLVSLRALMGRSAGAIGDAPASSGHPLWPAAPIRTAILSDHPDALRSVDEERDFAKHLLRSDAVETAPL